MKNKEITTVPSSSLCLIYVGCYADVIASSNRDLSGLGLYAANSIGGGSLEKCVSFCYSLNFNYAGAQNGLVFFYRSVNYLLRAVVAKYKAD